MSTETPAPNLKQRVQDLRGWAGWVWFLSLLAGLCLVGAVGINGNLSSRFAAGSQDWVSAVVVVFSAAVTFLQGGALLKAITDAVRTQGPTHDLRLAKALLIASASVLVVVLLVNTQLAWMARHWYYPPYGQDLAPSSEDGESIPAARAIEKYQRAVALDPNFQGAYERMGLAYETIGELDKSVAAFEAAYRLASVPNADYQPVAPIIGWTWVMMRRGDFADAMAPLDEGFHALDDVDQSVATSQATDTAKRQLLDNNQATRYQLLNNRAWANLGLQHFLAAQADANQARNMFASSRVPHCLMAYIAEAELNAKPPMGTWTSGDIVAEWAQCLHNVEPFSHRIEPLWLATARERLRAAGRDE